MNRDVVQTTVVGGRSPDADRAIAVPLSGIEKVLRRASGDLEFRARFLEHRSKILSDSGIELDPLDAELIDEVSENQLISIIRGIVTRYRRTTNT